MANPARSDLQPDVYADWDEDPPAPPTPADLGAKVTPDPNSLALRTSTGALAVGPATAADHAVPKATVDLLATNYNASLQALADQISTFAPKANPTLTGTTTVDRIRVTSTSDASATSTAHGIQVGADNNLNVIIDNNEILFRNNGVQEDSVPRLSYVNALMADTFKDPDWIDWGVSGGWTKNYSRYRRINGIFYWTAILTRASWASDTVVTTLSTANAPSFDHFLTGHYGKTNPQKFEVVVSTSGTISISNAGTGGLVISGSWPYVKAI